MRDRPAERCEAQFEEGGENLGTVPADFSAMQFNSSYG
jgi:hypothetical protein